MKRRPNWLAASLALAAWLSACGVSPTPTAAQPGSPRLGNLSTAGTSFADDLADLTQVYEQAGADKLRLYTTDPQNFGGDSTRLAKRGVGAGRFVTYHSATDLTRLEATAYFNAAEAPDDLLFFAAGNDGNFTAVSAARSPLAYQAGGWSKATYSVALPAGTRFVRVEFGPNSKQDWTVQLGQVRLEGYTQPGYAVDDLNDLGKAYDATIPTLRLDVTNPQNFAGDTSRLSRRGVGPGRYVAYQSSTDINGLEATAYFNAAEAPLDPTFSTSGDGASFTPVTATRSALTFITAGWSKATYRLRFAPGTRFVRLEFNPASTLEWTPQIGQIKLEGATLVTERPLPPPSPQVQEAITALRNVSKLKAEHPRLLATAADFDRLRAAKDSDATLRAWYDKLKGQADRLLTQAPSRYEIPDGLRLLATSRQVLSRVSTLGLLYQLDRNPAYAERAWKELEAAANFPDWNPTHFLDVAEMTHAFALGYDWLYDALTPEQRAVVRGAIVQKGLMQGIRVYRGLKEGADSRWFWTTAKINWNLVVNGGLGMGALAVGDEAPQVAEEVLYSGLESMRYALPEYKPDGSWSEGAGYWAFATRYLVAYLAASQTALGTDQGILGAYPGLAKTGDFGVGLNGPSQTFNYGDTGPGLVYDASLFWLARTFNKPVWAAYEQRNPSPTAQDFLWYTPVTASLAGAPLDNFFEDADVATLRSAWDNVNAVFAGFKAGGNADGHNDLDLGSFVFDALGIRWAEDLGQENYNLPGYFDYSPGGARWTYYRKRAEGQNTLVINPGAGPDQNPVARAEIVARGSSPQSAFVVADLSAAYDAQATSVRRGLALLDERRMLLLQDEIQTKAPAEVNWFMHTAANIEVLDGGRSALLSRGSAKRLWVTVLAGPGDALFSAMPAAPLPTSPNPAGQTVNTGIQKLALKMGNVGSTTLSVLFVPLQAGEPVPTAAPQGLRVTSLSEWQAYSFERARLSDLKVNGQSLPGFSPETFSYNVILPAGETKVPNVKGVTSGPGTFVLPAKASSVPGTTRLMVFSVGKPFGVASYTVHFSTARGTPVEMLPAVPVTAVTASGVDGTNVPENTLDGKLDTRWSAFGNGQWIQYDLGQTRQLGYVEIAFFNGDGRKTYFDVQVSNDGAAWRTVYGGESSGTSRDLEAFDFASAQARYVRVVGYGSTANMWNSLTEVVLHGQ